MTFEEMLRRWNKGIARGAQVNFARKVKVNRVTLSGWVNGHSVPSADMRPRLAKELGVSEEELMAALGRTPPPALREARAPYGEGVIHMQLSPEETEMLEEISEKDTRSPLDTIRWLIRAYGTGRLKETGAAPESEGHRDILTADLRRQMEEEKRRGKKTGS